MPSRAFQVNLADHTKVYDVYDLVSVFSQIPLPKVVVKLTLGSDASNAGSSTIKEGDASYPDTGWPNTWGPADGFTYGGSGDLNKIDVPGHKAQGSADNLKLNVVMEWR